MGTRRKEEPDRRCRHCGAHLIRKRFNGRLEDLGVFMRRSYCDQKCMAEAMLQGNISRGAYLARARRSRKAACESCGATEGLHVHHVDGNYRNNASDNHRTLCATCHLKLHWAKPDGHFRIRRWVLAEPLAALIAVCEESLAALPPELADRLDQALLAIRNGNHK